MAVAEQCVSADQATQCRHQPPCPPANAIGRLAAVVIAAHPEQGWSLLCNGLITFEDTGAIADEQAIPPRRPIGHQPTASGMNDGNWRTGKSFHAPEGGCQTCQRYASHR